MPDDLLAANEAYAAAFDLGDLPGPPARRLAVLTCMDARLDPLRLLGLRPGDAHVIRNAGAIATGDALRSLALSHWLLGTQRALVIGHTRCGSLTFTNDSLHARLTEAGVDAGGLDFLPFADLDEAVRESVRRIAESPLLPDPYAVTGCVYDVDTGRLREVGSA